MKNLFKTKSDIETAVANFTMLKSNAGWQILVEMLTNDINVLKSQILDGIGTEDQLDRKRDALKTYESVVNAPDYWIEKLKSPQSIQENDDPFYTIEELQKERRARV